MSDSVSSGWSSSDDGAPEAYRQRRAARRRGSTTAQVMSVPAPAPAPRAGPATVSNSTLDRLYAQGAAAQSSAAAELDTFLRANSMSRLSAPPGEATAGLQRGPRASRVPVQPLPGPSTPPPLPGRRGSDPTADIAAGPLGQPAGAALKKRPPRKKRVSVNLSRCKYDIVRECVEALGWSVDRDLEGLAAFASLVNVDKKEKDAAPAWTPAGAGNGGASSSLAANQQLPDPVALLNAMVQSERCQIVWSDVSVLTQSVSRLKCWQRVNHFPSMSLICRKVQLGKQLTRMEALFSDVYNFSPLSFSARSDFSAITQYCRLHKGKRTFILKPNAGCQGNGILLTKHPDRLIPSLPHDDYVCQLYIARPLLIERKKFDMRIYVLILSVAPLKVLIYDEGLIRMCTKEYVRPKAANLKNVTMHLTNYAVNKKSDSYAFGGGDGAAPAESGGDGGGRRFADDGDGSRGFKRDFAFFKTFIEAQFGEQGYRRIWQRIEKAVVLTILSAYHQIRHAYCACNPNSKSSDCRTCFELLGFDILLDDRGNPFVLEVNHSPSFATDSAIDYRIKRRLITDTLRHVNPYLIDVKRASDHQYRKAAAKKKYLDVDLHLMGTGFRPIYPPTAMAEREARAAARQREKEEEAARSAGAAKGGGESDSEDDELPPVAATAAGPSACDEAPPRPGAPPPATSDSDSDSDAVRPTPSTAGPGQGGEDGESGDESDDEQAPKGSDDEEENAMRLESPEELQELYDRIIAATAATLPGQSSLRSQRASMSSSTREAVIPGPPLSTAARTKLKAATAAVTAAQALRSGKRVEAAAGSGAAAVRRGRTTVTPPQQSDA